MRRAAILLVFVALGSVTLAVAQDAGVAAAIRLPLAVRGVVSRDTTMGCGQSWINDHAVSTVTLDVDARGRARLSVRAQIVEASGGVALLGDAERHQSSSSRSLDVTWSGRARVEGSAVVIALRALVETLPQATSGIVVTNHSVLEAQLTCTREEHPIFAATRPTSYEPEPEVARRTILSCAFEPSEREGPLPRPVADALSTPFFLDAGAGISTDVHYEGYVTLPAGALVAREPGGFTPP